MFLQAFATSFHLVNRIYFLKALRRRLKAKASIYTNGHLATHKLCGSTALTISCCAILKSEPLLYHIFSKTFIFVWWLFIITITPQVIHSSGIKAFIAISEKVLTRDGFPQPNTFLFNDQPNFHGECKLKLKHTTLLFSLPFLLK